MLVERSDWSSDETSAAADVDVDAGALVESAGGCDEPRDSDAIAAVDLETASDAIGRPLATLDVIPVSRASISSEAPVLPLTPPPLAFGSPDAELEVVPASEPCPVDSLAPPPVA